MTSTKKVCNGLIGCSNSSTCGAERVCIKVAKNQHFHELGVQFSNLKLAPILHLKKGKYTTMSFYKDKRSAVAGKKLM